MKLRSAIALAYVRRLWRSKRSTHNLTIALKLCQRACMGPPRSRGWQLGNGERA